MKYILLDVGNSFTKISHNLSRKFTNIKPINTEDIDKTLSIINKLQGADRIIIASTNKNGLILNKRIKGSRLIKSKDVPIKTKYNIKQIGIDRLLSAYGALKNNRPPFIVMSLGTAITIDYINKENEFYGGIIFTGIEKNLNALKSINKRFETNKTADYVFPAKNTKQSLNAGLICFIRGLLREFIARNNLSRKTKVILAGGDSFKLKNILEDFNIHLKSNLVIDGMKRIILS